MLGMPMQERGHISTCPQGIPQRHSNIALPALMAYAAYGAALGALQELDLGPVKKVLQLLAAQAIARVKVFQRATLRKLVPGADQLAVVTAINAVAHQRAQFQRNGSAVFNRQVRNAAARIQPVRRDDGLCGANV